MPMVTRSRGSLNAGAHSEVGASSEIKGPMHKSERRKMTTTARRGEEEEEEQTPDKKTKITQQQSQQQEEDRISQLPDDILHPILSLLTLKEACITSALSKRWRNLFPTLPCLHFDDFSFSYSSARSHEHEINSGRWVESVSDVLESRRAPVRVCTITSMDFYEFRKDFGNIMRFLCNDGIQDLTLNNEGHYLYPIPSCLYFCRTLTRIELGQCILKVPSKFSLLRRLNTLKLTECMVKDGDGDMQRLILGCRAVERLTLDHCHRLRNLAVDAPKLALLDVTTNRPLAVSIVNAPRLVSVIVRFIYDSRDHSRTDDEDDDTGDGGGTDDEGEGRRLVGLLESLGNIQNLWLEKDTYLKGLAVPVTLKSLLPKMKKLSLIMRPNDTLMLSVVSCLINSCPNLEVLVLGDIDLYDWVDHMYPEASMLYYWDQQKPSDCIRNSLITATVVLKDKNYLEYWIKFAKFLLKNACILKNLVIHCDNQEVGLSMLEDLYRKMFLIRPASPYVGIELKTARSCTFYRPSQFTFGAL